MIFQREGAEILLCEEYIYIFPFTYMNSFDSYIHYKRLIGKL